MIVLAVDPGLDKCGIAVLDFQKVFIKEIVLRYSLFPRAKELFASYNISEIIVGKGTGSGSIISELKGFSVPIKAVEEEFSTLEARKLYWKENPPSGLLRLIPASLLFPSRPIDDYAAVLLGLRYLKS